MTTASPTAGHHRVSRIQSHRDHCIPEQDNKPANRSTEALLSTPPTHESSTLKGIDPTGNTLTEQRGTGPPWSADPREQTGTFRCVSWLEIGWIHSTALGKPDGSRTRLTIHERLGDRGPFAILLKIRLRIDEILDHHEKPTRRSRDRQFTMLEPQIPEITANPLLQLVKGRGNEIGGEFFSADLKQKRVRHSTCVSKWRLYWKPLR